MRRDPTKLVPSAVARADARRWLKELRKAAKRRGYYLHEGDITSTDVEGQSSTSIKLIRTYAVVTIDSHFLDADLLRKLLKRGKPGS